MKLEGITFDLWGTVLWPRDPDGKLERRMELLLDAVQAVGVACTREVLLDAWRAAFAEADERIKQDLQDMGPPGRWEILARRLEVPAGALPYQLIEPIYQDLTLEFPPPPMPGIDAALRALHGGYRLGLICNTGVTGGRVLRQVLDRYGLLGWFDATVFSNEYGRVKPDPSIFHHTLGLLGGTPPARAAHVGDLEELDVDGAHNAGMHAFRYVHPGLQELPQRSRARRVIRDWSDFRAALAELEDGGPGAEPTDEATL